MTLPLAGDRLVDVRANQKSLASCGLGIGFDIGMPGKEYQEIFPVSPGEPIRQVIW